MDTLSLAMDDQKSCIFLGAGASRDTGLPLGDEGAAAIIKTLFALAGASELWKRVAEPVADPWPRFEAVLSSLARYERSAPRTVVSTFSNGGRSASHRLLVTVFSRPTLWLTTNFDDQIERALDEAGQTYVAVADRNQIATECSRDDVHVIIKLHGDATTKDDEWDLGARIDQILRAFPESVAAALADAASGRSLLVVGYAARDPDLAPLVEELVQGASRVAWVSYGEPEPVVSRLASEARAFSYYGDGAPLALEEASRSPAPAATEGRRWEDMLHEALRSIERGRLIQSVADLCLTRGDAEARACILELHELLRSSEAIHEAWMLRRSVEVSLRNGASAVDATEHYSEPLLLIARDLEAPAEARIEAYAALGMHLFSTGSVRELEVLLAEAEDVVQQGEPANRVQHLQRLGISRAYQGSERLESALRDLQAAVELAREEDLPLLEIEGNNHLAVVLMRSGEARRAEEVLRGTWEAVKEIGDPRKKLIYNVNLAEAVRIQGLFSEAALLNKKAIRDANRLDDQEVVGNLVGNLGLCLLYAGDVAEAEQAFKESAEIAAQFGGEMEANALYNRGWLRVLVGRWHEAAEVLAWAADAYRGIGASGRAGGAEALRGWCQIRTDALSDAERTLEDIRRREEVPEGTEFREKYLLLCAGVERPPSSVSEAQQRDVLEELRAMPEERVHYIIALLACQENPSEQIAAEAWSDIEEIKLPPLASQLAEHCKRLGWLQLIPNSTRPLSKTLAELGRGA